MIALAAALLISTNAPAAEVVANCRSMIPADAELKGRIVLRSRKGIVQAEYGYDLVRKAGATDLKLTKDDKDVEFEKSGQILGTDVTWSDLTLDYLWWDDVSFDAEREGETVHGQVCTVIVMKKGERQVRVWVDRKTGALMQAEEIKDGKAVRRLWGTRLKKFGERWMANVMEVETIGSGHRTKITVEELKVEESK
ncbi:MAG: outer membrane lipoprotein-sorting protein [Kiritimatiellae bacterium]|nr:outer membrane lipoprotein-sorting protein [Kiritimatiellia bacterium]